MVTVVISSFGTRGDLGPFLWLARSLGRAGIRPLLLLCPLDARRATARGLEAIPVGPEVDATRTIAENPSLMGVRGSRLVLRDLYLPFTRPLFAATKEVIAREHAAAVVSHLACFGSAWAAEAMRVPSVAVHLAPVCVFSRDTFRDYPAPARMAMELMMPLARRVARYMANKVARELGVPARTDDPFSEAIARARKVIGMWSPLFRPPSRCQPRNLALAGFPVPPADATEALPDGIESFLADGPPPVAVAMGSSAIDVAGGLLGRAARAAQRAGRRVVVFANPGEVESGDGILSVRASPYDKVFPRCAAVVIHGGIGTSATALRAGVPTVVVPFAHDQPDNAVRLEAMGVGTWAFRWTSERGLARVLRRVLSERTRSRAAECGRAIRAEGDGTERAAGVIASLVRPPGSAGPPRPPQAAARNRR